jgi:UDP-GlcNAc:undecaprenyl-phosphate GlcNAc-1-phosphate transferase
MRYEYLLIFGLAVVISMGLTPWIIRLARLVGAIDVPGDRKIHSKATPRLGGAAVWTAFVLTVAAACRSFPDLYAAASSFPYRWDALGAALLLVVSLGTWDDIHPLRAGHKLAVQLLIGTLVYAGGARIESVGNPFEAGVLGLGPLAFPVTVLWVVGITNAFNLIDGLDGLASGIAIISSLTIFAVAGLNQDAVTAALALAIAGSILGFLPFNFNPARIFLGDSGSLFLGFILSVVSIHSSAKGSTAVSITVPLLALGLPIMDTLLAMIRRMLRSFLGDPAAAGSIRRSLRCIFRPDKEHIHHRLLARGIPHRTAVLILYLVSCAFGLCAFVVSARNLDVSIMLILIGTLAAAGVSKLGYREMAFIRTGMFLPLYDKPLMKRMAFHRALDLLFMAVAFCASLMFTREAPVGWAELRPFIGALALTCIVQAVAFSAGGIYRGLFRMAGMGDVLRIGKTLLIGVLLSALAAQLWFPGLTGLRSITFWVLDFYLLASLSAGLRISFRALNYIFRRDSQGGKPVLIYGANPTGLLVLQKTLNNESPAVRVIGFLDDDPDVEGKYLDGYPVYGGHWKLDAILNRQTVQEIIISAGDIQTEAFRRITSIAEAHGVTVRDGDTRIVPRRGSPPPRQPVLAGR